MDFAAIGEAMAMGQAIKNANQSAQQWIDWSSRQVAIARAERDARDAGRMAQLRLLREALERLDPGHDLFQETGLMHRDGSPEIRWHRAYDQAYDIVAVANQIPPCSKSVAPGEARRMAVLREPVTCRRILFCRTWWWRGVQHRSKAGAERARATEAEQAARG
jgi:hypothetical protein